MQGDQTLGPRHCSIQDSLPVVQQLSMMDVLCSLSLQRYVVPRMVSPGV